jgi:O-succinylhomoserine sulfhydrylase
MQQRLAALEGAQGCVATASGMAAILSLVMALLKSGDHIVASQSIFGATQQMFGAILPRFGVETSFVRATDVDAYARAMRPNTKLVFLETPSNPLTEVIDITAVAAITRAAGVLLAVDNCFCTPVLQRPLELGGAVCGAGAVTEEVFKFLRTAGPTLSPFNAWIILKGLETLRIRMQAQSANALDLARWLEAQPQVQRVFYPGLPSHPQHALAQTQQSAGGAILSFEVRGGREEAWRVVDATRLLSITANLGDTKSTITHPASTTHGRISAEQRAAAGIGENLLRIAVGLEAVADLQADLARGLARI